MNVILLTGILVFGMTANLKSAARSDSAFHAFDRSFRMESFKKKHFESNGSGVLIKGEALEFIRKNGIQPVSQEFLREGTPQYFAVSKFKFDEKITGYVIRGPGQQLDSTAVELFLIDRNSKQLLGSHELADMREIEQSDSWLVDLNGDGKHEVLTRSSIMDATQTWRAGMTAKTWVGNQFENYDLSSETDLLRRFWPK